MTTIILTQVNISRSEKKREKEGAEPQGLELVRLY